MPGTDIIWMEVVMMLCLLAGILTALQHDLRYHTVRVYNWDGARYRFLGRERLHKENDTYVIKFHERILDMSRTTRYRLLASRELVRKRRFAGLRLRVGANEAWLPMEERMVQEIYDKRQVW